MNRAFKSADKTRTFDSSPTHFSAMLRDTLVPLAGEKAASLRYARRSSATL